MIEPDWVRMYSHVVILTQTLTRRHLSLLSFQSFSVQSRFLLCNTLFLSFLPLTLSCRALSLSHTHNHHCVSSLLFSVLRSHTHSRAHLHILYIPSPQGLLYIILFWSLLPLFLLFSDLSHILR